MSNGQINCSDTEITKLILIILLVDQCEQFHNLIMYPHEVILHTAESIHGQTGLTLVRFQSYELNQ